MTINSIKIKWGKQIQPATWDWRMQRANSASSCSSIFPFPPKYLTKSTWALFPYTQTQTNACKCTFSYAHAASVQIARNVYASLVSSNYWARVEHTWTKCNAPLTDASCFHVRMVVESRPLPSNCAEGTLSTKSWHQKHPHSAQKLRTPPTWRLNTTVPSKPELLSFKWLTPRMVGTGQATTWTGRSKICKQRSDQYATILKIQNNTSRCVQFRSRCIPKNELKVYVKLGSRGGAQSKCNFTKIWHSNWRESSKNVSKTIAIISASILQSLSTGCWAQCLDIQGMVCWHLFAILWAIVILWRYAVLRGKWLLWNKRIVLRIQAQTPPNK